MNKEKKTIACIMPAVALAAADGAAVYIYGVRMLIVIGICAGVCFVCDILCTVLSHKHIDPYDLSAVCTGLAIAGMLPASVPYTLCAAACVFAVCVVKHPLGGIIPPSAAGYIFAELSAPMQVLRYPRAAKIPLGTEPDLIARGDINAFSVNSPYSDMELLVGRAPGPAAAGFIVVIVICAVVLIYSGRVSGIVYLGGLFPAVWAYCIHGIDSAKALLLGSMHLFVLTFIISDTDNIPKTRKARLAFALYVCAVLIMIREISEVSYPAVYAVMLTAPFRLLERTEEKK